MASLILMQRPISLCRTRRVFGVLVLTLCSPGLVACKHEPAPAPVNDPDPREEPLEPASSSAPRAPSPPPSPSQGPVVARCHELPRTTPFRIGDRVIEHAAADTEDAGPDDDDEVPDPYAVELGPARPDGDGFVLSALHATKGQSHALLALLTADAGSGNLVDLGPVHGDPDPPLFAAHGKDWVLATPDTDAGGGMLKLGLLRDARSLPKLSWGAEISGVRRDSTFALEISGEHALLAYAAETAGKIRVYGVLLDPNNLKQKPVPEALSAPGADVDSPRLAIRRGGYWLAVARSLDAPKPKPKVRPGESATDLAEDDSLLDVGTRRIELIKLDAQGKVVSSPLVVTAPGARPISFDLAAVPDGSAYVGFRGDDSTPGAEGGALELVHVRADGSFEKLDLAGDLGGTGTPSLLVDESAPSPLWLSAAGESGATSFARVGEHTKLAVDSFVRGGDLIAARAGNLLLARAKGTATELSVVSCAD